MLGALEFLFVFAFIVVIFFWIVNWKIFVKAGRAGWEGIIPIYNSFIMLKIVGKPWWWLILMCIPGIGVIWAIWSLNMLSKSFGKNEGFTVGLLLLSIIFFPILAFGDARYIGPYGDAAAFAAAQQPHFDFDAQQQQNS
jgi:hypothetical protein